MVYGMEMEWNFTNFAIFYERLENLEIDKSEFG